MWILSDRLRLDQTTRCGDFPKDWDRTRPLSVETFWETETGPDHYLWRLSERLRPDQTTKCGLCKILGHKQTVKLDFLTHWDKDQTNKSGQLHAHFLDTLKSDQVHNQFRDEWSWWSKGALSMDLFTETGPDHSARIFWHTKTAADGWVGLMISRTSKCECSDTWRIHQSTPSTLTLLCMLRTWKFSFSRRTMQPTVCGLKW